MSNFFGNLRHAARSLSRAPASSLTIVLTVALGIGGTTAVFAIIQGVLLQPLPYPEPEQLVVVRTDVSGSSWGFSVADYLALEEQQTSFEDVALMRSGSMTWVGGEGAVLVSSRRVTPSFFRVLGIQPVLGRTFTQEEGKPQGGAPVIVTYGFWKSKLGGDPDVLGKTLQLDGAARTVVGLLPSAGGTFETGRDVFTPLQLEPPTRKGPFFYTAIGRLRRDVSRSVAATELHRINDRIFPMWQDSWTQRGSTWVMTDLKEAIVGDVGNVLLMTLGAVALVLLIACANTANLLVSRGSGQRRELAIRAALGASRGRLLWLLLSQAVLLALMGVAAGSALAALGIRATVNVGSDFIPRTNEIGFSPPVVLFLAVVTLASIAMFALIPSFQCSRIDPGRDLHMAGRGTTSGRGISRLRRALVASQFAITTPLLIGAVLLGVSLGQLHRVDTGFDPERVLTAGLVLPAEVDDPQSTWKRIAERVRMIPGVEAAGVSNGRPPAEYSWGNNFVLEDQPVPPGESQPTVPWLVVTPEYFDALGVRLVEGQMFKPDDESALEVLVDQTWARRFYPDRSPVGRRFRHGGCTGEGCDWWTVSGVVEDVRYTGLDNPGEGTMYMGFHLNPEPFAYLVMRTTVDPLSVLPSLRRMVRDVVPDAPIVQVATGRELIAGALFEPRYLSLLIGAFAGVALLLSLVGVHGVMVFFVQQHRKDIGTRIALGGTPSAVAGGVLQSTMRLVTAGTLIGVAGAFMLTRFLRSMLFGVVALDPTTFVGVALLLMGMGLVACLVPAARAARLNPMTTLREE